MKKIATCIFTLMLIFTLSGISYASPESLSGPAPITTPIDAAESSILLLRLDEIKAMNKSGLNSSEKKELRKEVRAIRARLTDGGGVYISAGALIIIVILLIILF